MWFIYFHKLHPLFVHLPIGILFFVGILMFVNRKNKRIQYRQSIYLGLMMCFATAVFSVASGWFLAQEGSYDVDTLWWHKVLGFSTTSTLLLLVITYKSKKLHAMITPILFLAAIGLMVGTGHHGGVLTHGADFLFKSNIGKKKEIKQVQSINELVAYTDVVKPILNKHCTSCHRTSKKKGELDLSTWDGIIKGGNSGSLFDRVNNELSLLSYRIHLPLDDELHMPPKGKSVLTEEIIAILDWWTRLDPCKDCFVVSKETPDSIQSVLKKYTKNQTNLDTANLKILTNKAVNKLLDLDIRVTGINNVSPLVSISLKNQPSISKKQLKALRQINRNIKELDLSDSQLSNAFFRQLKEYKNLNKIRLTGTNITDEDLKSFNGLMALKTLNLYKTGITNDAIKFLKQLSGLENLYVWQTKIDQKGIQQLQNDKPKLNIITGIDKKVFKSSALNPPVIVNKQRLFEDSISIEIQQNIQGTKVYYTLDGSIPDSTDLVFGESLVLHDTSPLSLIAYKQGWQKSEPIKKQFIKKTQKVNSVTLSSKPAAQYGGNEEKLIDQKESILDFKSGDWLAYQGEHMTSFLHLSKPEEINRVFVSCLSDTRSWIFYPASIMVSLSSDGNQYKKVNKLDIDIIEHKGVQQNYFEITFPKQKAQYLKIDIENILKNPSWHESPGGDSWVFVDEILVN